MRTFILISIVILGAILLKIINLIFSKHKSTKEYNKLTKQLRKIKERKDNKWPQQR